jgi:peptidyl-dipeptidase A
MLSKGASQPWQQTMKELTGGESMDAGAVLEYFAPLQTWLEEQNEGQTCGWQATVDVPAPTPAAAPAEGEAMPKVEDASAAQG